MSTLLADEVTATWALDYAVQIVEAELRSGEAPVDLTMVDLDDDELWKLYERRAEITSPRVRRAIDLLEKAGCIVPPEFRDDDADEDDET